MPPAESAGFRGKWAADEINLSAQDQVDHPFAISRIR
jgi:hypothetical protein